MRHYQVNLFGTLKGSFVVHHQALEDMASGFGCTRYPSRLFRKLLPGAAFRDSPPVPPHCILVPRIRLSPLRVHFLGMGIETSNRAVRHFCQEYGFAVDEFLRVSITEEDGSPLHGSELTQTVRGHLKDSLVNGIDFCGRKFVFLAYSSSQLTECSAWMVSESRHSWDVVTMRNELGDFSRCRTPSKFGARLGQCFSTTFTRSIERSSLQARPVVIDDIEGARGCHSDGTGLIRRRTLYELLLELPIGPKDLKYVSIIQIRYGGAKGTLTAYDEPMVYLPEGTPNADVYIRDSMIKFGGTFAGVEVCSIGKRVPYYLNRNVILLLAALGIHEQHFLDMQRNMLVNLDKMLDDGLIALQMVRSLTGAGNESRKTLLNMLSAGLTPSTEPFLYDCLSAMRNHQLFALRKKSRILVEKGAVLVGGLDETGEVPEGFVFFQIGSSPFVGRVLVTKHPVMHPGDVRMLTAIDVPQLRGHRNVILFSKHGDRPEADKMSGSDLDGDEFAVTWDKRLFLESNKEAMDYEGTDTSRVRRLSGKPEKVTEELVVHFLDHIKNASVGQISMLWLDHAASKGATSDECTKLAELHSIAVDYPKSGVPAEIPSTLRLKSSVPRPHWREKKASPSYQCSSVIGKLYDQVKAARRHENKDAVAKRKIDQYGTIVCEAYPDWSPSALRKVYSLDISMALMPSECQSSRSNVSQDLQAWANDERASYEQELLRIMNKYKIRGEGEALTGCIRKYHKFYKKRQHDFSQEVRRLGVELTKKYRRSFFQCVERVSRHIKDRPSGDFTDGLIRFQFDDADNDEDEVDEQAGEDENESNLIFDEDDDSWSEGSIEDDKLKEIEEIALKDPALCNDDEVIVQRVAFALAGSCYDSAYHPEHRWTDRNRKLTLYSFPWMVADVISHACLSFRTQSNHFRQP